MSEVFMRSVAQVQHLRRAMQDTEQNLSLALMLAAPHFRSELMRELQILFGTWGDLRAVWYDHSAITDAVGSCPVALELDDRIVTGQLDNRDRDQVLALTGPISNLLGFCDLDLPSRQCLRLSEQGISITDRPTVGTDLRDPPPATDHVWQPSAALGELHADLRARLADSREADRRSDEAWEAHRQVTADTFLDMMQLMRQQTGSDTLTFHWTTRGVSALRFSAPELDDVRMQHELKELNDTWSTMHPSGVMQALIAQGLHTGYIEFGSGGLCNTGTLLV